MVTLRAGGTLATLLLWLAASATGAGEPVSALGLTAADLNAEQAQAQGLQGRGGALVESVEPNGPAAKAGVKPGDVIVQLGPAQVNGLASLRQALTRVSVGRPTDVVFVRQKQTYLETITPREGGPASGNPPREQPAPVPRPSSEGQSSPPPPLSGTAGGTNTGDLIVCREVVDGQPVGATDHFPQAQAFWAWVRYAGVPANTLAWCVWTQGGQEIHRYSREMGGDGAVWFSLTTSAADGFPAGAYQVTITAGDRTLGSRDFTVGPTPARGDPSQAPPATSTPPSSLPTNTGGKTGGETGPPGAAPPSAAGWLGIIAQTRPARRGQPQVLVWSVIPDSPAAGRLQAGDVLLQADQTSLTSVPQLTDLLAGQSVGREVIFLVRRKKQERTVVVEVAAQPPAHQRPMIVAGQFQSESFTGTLQGYLDPAHRTAHGSISGGGMGALEGSFQGTWAPDTGAVQVDFQAEVSLLIKATVKGVIRGQIDRSGRGEGTFEGTGPLGVDRGTWTCEPLVSPDVAAL